MRCYSHELLLFNTATEPVRTDCEGECRPEAKQQHTEEAVAHPAGGEEWARGPASRQGATDHQDNLPGKGAGGETGPTDHRSPQTPTPIPWGGKDHFF